MKKALDYRHRCSVHCIEAESLTPVTLAHHMRHCWGQKHVRRCRVENDNSSLELGILPVSCACVDRDVQKQS